MIPFFETIRAAMESRPRCILIFDPVRGWACTEIEGAPFDSLRWHICAAHAVGEFAACGVQQHIDESVYQGLHPEAFEWWEKRGGWIRPLPAWLK